MREGTWGEPWGAARPLSCRLPPSRPFHGRRMRCCLPAALPLGYLGESSSNTEAGTPRGRGAAQGRKGCSLSRGPCAGHPRDGRRGAWWQPAQGEAVDGWQRAGGISRRRVPGLSLQCSGSRSRPCSRSTGTIRSRSGTSLGQGARTRRAGVSF